MTIKNSYNFFQIWTIETLVKNLGSFLWFLPINLKRHFCQIKIAFLLKYIILKKVNKILFLVQLNIFLIITQCPVFTKTSPYKEKKT